MQHYELAEYRYQLDLGGLSGTTWGSLRWKMCAGLLVFKVESWANDMWHTTLEPWTHYIPVRVDVSDLHDQYIWAQDNPERAQEIARTGQQRCLETFGPDKAKAQFQAAVQRIPAAEAADIKETDEILDQMIQQKTDMRGVMVVAAS
jgi:Glycosyl transferase family 90